MSIYSCYPNNSGCGMEIAPTLENQINGFMRYAGTQLGSQGQPGWTPILWTLSGGGTSASIPAGGAQLITGFTTASGISEATVLADLTENFGPATSLMNGIAPPYGQTLNVYSGLVYVNGVPGAEGVTTFRTPNDLPYE